MIDNLTALSFNHIIGTVYIRLQIFVELNFTRLYLSSERKKEVVVLYSRPPQNVKLGTFTS